jgi:hypothetical protein
MSYSLPVDHMGRREQLFTFDRTGKTTLVSDVAFGTDRQGERFWVATAFGLLGVEYTLSQTGMADTETVRTFIVGPDGSVATEETFPSSIRWWSLAGVADRALLFGYDDHTLYASLIGCAD